MSAVPFDTYRFTRRLIDAGMAEKLAGELVTGATEAAESLTTKADLDALKAAISQTISSHFLKAIWWLLGTAAASTLAIIGTIVKVSA